MDYKGKIITRDTVEPTQTSASGVWTLDQAAQAVENNTWPIANVPNPISRSLRFNSADSAYLNRTPASAGNRRTWTFSFWVKRSTLGAEQRILFSNDNGLAHATIEFTSGDALAFADYTDPSPTYELTTTQLFRDVSAWYHIVAVFDTTNGTSGDRMRLYVNGSRVTAFSTANYPTQNFDGYTNNNVPHGIGARIASPVGQYLNGYLTQIQMIDGQALDATYFGMTDPRTGAWISKPYTGTYGTNGFYLNFSDNSSTAALGTDYSGNSNTWTTNNFSVTAGSGNDSMVDVPTNWVAYNTGDVGGVIRGNYCTWNPLVKSGTSNGNLTVATTSSATGTIAMPSSGGKYYFEIKYDASTSSADMGVGIINQDNGTFVFVDGIGYYSSGGKYVEGVGTSYGASWGIGDIIGVAVNMDAGEVTFYKNGASQGAISITSGKTGWLPNMANGGLGQTQTATLNAGQRPFAYTPPAGFKSLCTTNLPEPTILDGGDYFNAVTYTGTGTTGLVVTTGFQPDFVWIKDRQDPNSHVLFDAVRGATKTLSSNLSNAESTEGTGTGLLSFDSTGFTLGTELSVSPGSTNASPAGRPYMSWSWKESATSGFDIVTYTGDGVAGRTVSHNLGVAPAMIICKNRVSASNWRTYHTSLGATQAVVLDGTGTAQTQTYFWNDTAPTSSVFSVGTNADVNENGAAIVAYLFAAVPGFSAFGSYTGNGSTDGPFVYTGFRPAFILTKRTDSTSDWWLMDEDRLGYNGTGAVLKANANYAEASNTTWTVVDQLSNGFKVRYNDSDNNANGGTYIYAAFAENPFKYSNAR